MSADRDTRGWDRLLAHVLGRRDSCGLTPPIVALFATSYRWTNAELEAFLVDAAAAPAEHDQPTSR